MNGLEWTEMTDLEWFARNLTEWPADRLHAGMIEDGFVFKWYPSNTGSPDAVQRSDEGPIERAQWEYERERLMNQRIDIIGQNGNDGEHYDQPATVRNINEPVIYTTATSLTVHHNDGHIDVTAVHAGGVVLVDHEGGETHIPSLAVLDAVRDAMARIVGE